MSTPGGSRQFVLIRKLGEGAFGAVYLADYASAGGFRKRVAIKLLHPTWDPESDAVSRLRDEARLLGRLQHPNIVRVDDLLQLNGRWGVVMEALSGADLERVIGHLASRGERIPTSIVTAILLGVAAAIRAAASMLDDDGRALTVVHRDIKPSNIVLSDTGGVKVLDFGVARAAFAGRESRTGEVVYGSLGYMAPERVLGEVEDTSGDVYAIAVVGCELLLLETLGKCRLRSEAHDAEMDGVVARIAAIEGGASPALCTLLRQMLRYESSDRPSIVEVHTRLAELARLAEGPALESWAAAIVEPLRDAKPDPIAGSILSESNVPAPVPPVEDELLAVATPSEALPAAVPESRKAHAPAHSSGELPVPPRSGGSRVWLGLLALGLVGAGWWGLFGRMADAPTAPELAVHVDAPAASNSGVEAVPKPEAEQRAEAISLPTPLPSPAVGAVRPERTRPTPSPTTLVTPASPAPESGLPAAQGEGAAAAVEEPIVRLRAVKFTLASGEGLAVRCGDVHQTGTGSVLLRGVPAGDCVVDSGGMQAHITVDTPRGIVCAAEGASFVCR